MATTNLSSDNLHICPLCGLQYRCCMTQGSCRYVDATPCGPCLEVSGLDQHDFLKHKLEGVAR